MDSITQIVIGIATVEACAGKKLKNKTFLVGTILGTLPDLDVWIGKLFSYETEVLFHRSFTHSILGIIILSPIIAWICRKIWKDLTFKQWTITTAAAFATHILIDLFTSWGVQLFFPFNPRISFKTIFVVDFFYTIPWIVTLILVYRTKDFVKRMQLLKKGFFITTCYLLLTIGIKLYVVQQVESYLLAQKAGDNFTVKPTFSNFILWNITTHQNNNVYTMTYSLFDTQPLHIEQSITINKELNDTFASNKKIKKLIEASENWYNIELINDSTYHFNDLRFGIITKEDGTQQHVFSYEITRNDDDLSIRPLPKQLRDGKKTLIKTWTRLKGN